MLRAGARGRRRRGAPAEGSADHRSARRHRPVRHEPEEGARFWGTLLEGTWKFCDWNTVYGRFEAVDRDLFELRFKRQRPEEIPLDRTRVYAGTLGYLRDFALIPKATTGVGADVTFYRFTDRLDDVYSTTPVSFHVFARIRFDIGMGGGHMAHSMD